MKLNTTREILLILLAIILLSVMPFFYLEYQYSENKVVRYLTKEVNAKLEDYHSFFNYATGLKDEIMWDSLQRQLDEVNYNPYKGSVLNFRTSKDVGFGISYDGLFGCFISLPESTTPVYESSIAFEEKLGLSPEKLDTLIISSGKIGARNLSIHSNGSIVIERSIGRELFDRDSYEIIFTYETAFLPSNYKEVQRTNIFIGRVK